MTTPNPLFERAAYVLAKQRNISFQRAREVIEFEEPHLMDQLGNTPVYTGGVPKRSSTYAAGFSKSKPSTEPSKSKSSRKPAKPSPPKQPPRTKQQIADDVKEQAKERASKSGKPWGYEFERILREDPGLWDLQRVAPSATPETDPVTGEKSLRKLILEEAARRYWAAVNAGVEVTAAEQRVRREMVDALTMTTWPESEETPRTAAHALLRAGVSSSRVAAVLRQVV